jgi:hypothetical protein
VYNPPGGTPNPLSRNHLHHCLTLGITVVENTRSPHPVHVPTPRSASPQVVPGFPHRLSTPFPGVFPSACTPCGVCCQGLPGPGWGTNRRPRGARSVPLFIFAARRFGRGRQTMYRPNPLPGNGPTGQPSAGGVRACADARRRRGGLSAVGLAERMNSPQQLHEVRLRGRGGPAACGVPGICASATRNTRPPLKPHAACEAFRSRCGGFSRSAPLGGSSPLQRPLAGSCPLHDGPPGHLRSH